MFTEDEKTILRNLPKEHKWIARDFDGMIYVYTNIPERLDRRFRGDKWICLNIFDNLFKNVTWENSPIYFREPVVLSDKEHDYLKFVLKPFRSQIRTVKKCHSNNDMEFIRVEMSGDEILFPFFDVGKMYKGMEPGREYTLEELHIELT